MGISKGFAVLVAVVAFVVYFQMSGLSQGELKNRISGKRVVVTGASLGIGREIVKEYASLGAAEIVVVARSQDKLESLRDEVYGSLPEGMPKPRIHVVPADLSSEETCRGVIDQSLEAMGAIDYLVLNHITNSQYGLWTGRCHLACYSYLVLSQSCHVFLLITLINASNMPPSPLRQEEP